MPLLPTLTRRTAILSVAAAAFASAKSHLIGHEHACNVLERIAAPYFAVR